MIVESEKKKESYLISIIIPLYNCESYIVNTIESLEKQRFQDFEVILIDDGSNDSTYEMAIEYLSKTKLFWKMIKQSNKGVSATRNRGIRESRGDLISFVDGDDWLHCDMLLHMYTALEKYNVDAVMCKYEERNLEVNDAIEEKLNIPENVKLTGHEIKEKLIYNMISGDTFGKSPIMGSVCRFLIKRDIIKNNHICFDEGVRFSEDLLFCIDTLNVCNSVYILGEVLYYYRINASSATSKYDEGLVNKQQLLFDKLEERTKDIPEDRKANRIFLSVIAIIINICKKANSDNFIKKINEISKVCSSPLVKNVISSIDKSKLSKLEKIKFYMIKYRFSILLFIYYSNK